jgi:hypothetical protein
MSHCIIGAAMAPITVVPSAILPLQYLDLIPVKHSWGP